MKIIRKILFLFQIAISLLLISLVYVSDTSDANQSKIHSKNVHETLYLDYSFTEEEKEYIIAAAYEWQEETDHLVIFDIEMLPTNKVLDFNNGILIKKVDITDPDIILLDNVNANATLGLYRGNHAVPHIKLCSTRIAPDIYKAVVLHELGHFLGLPHVKGVEGIQTLMYPSINFGSNHITRDDLINFCKLHGCIASNLSNY